VTTLGPKPDENELLAYVDRQLDDVRSGQIEGWRASDPEIAATVAHYEAQNRALHDAFAPLLARPVGARFGDLAVRRSQPARIWQIAAMVALLVGGAGGWVANDYLSPDRNAETALARDAVLAHRIYEVEVRHPVEVAANQEQHLIGWLSKRLDAPVRAPDLSPRGFHLMGGRLLPAATGPAAQFMYENQKGDRLTLYVERNRSGRETSFRFAADGEISAFYWKDGPLAYALLGRVDHQQLQALARICYNQLNP